ncbi:MAG: MarR family winged helix-turn-helix transcriptional regulator [Peptoniphilus sp.]|nr:MarR family winged helix-turn-helix transcriptional regulator [Peptoniphilus sp.]MDD7362859.1 MarR family winged helix-turn-helix transcriptional regulator [Bacillota bacterium]MDY6043949.1 MarR family winged helix-turn-helix transcriptional regulator [Peptoniphilus sp.]
MCYCTNLRRSAHAISAFYDERLKASGITASQYYLLINLSRMGSANITHWATCVGLDRSTMARNIKPLEAQMLLERTSGRGKTYKLSDKGFETLKVAVPLWEDAQTDIERFLGDRDAEAILRIGQNLQYLK